MAERKKIKVSEKKRQELVEKWKKQFEVDRNNKKSVDSLFDVYEEYYQGKRTFGNLKTEGYNHDREVRTVVNFVRMVIEALIDLSVPESDLQAVALDDETPVKLLNHYVRYVCRAGNLEQINLENERRVKKFGGCFYKVHWDNAVKNGSYVGDIVITDPHPKHIIPNAGAVDMDDIEHYHHILNKTEKYILRRFPHITKEDLEDNATLYKEYDEFSNTDTDYISSGTSESASSDSGLKRYSIIETTFRDDDGDICKLWWSGDLLLDYIPKFYWHRDEKGEPTRYEYLEPGTKIRVGTDDKGEPIYRTIEEQTDENGEPLTDADGIKLGEKVEYYIPTCWDLIYQEYIPRDLEFWGTSMIDDIADIYEAILKGIYIHEEQLLRGTNKIATDNTEDAQKLNNPGGEVITLTGQVKVIDMGARADAILWVEKLKEWLQLITGATNAQLGVHDPGVRSERQAQLYVSQANFKAALASTYKAIAFKKLYNTVACFAMAFCDDDRPFRLSGDNKNKPEYGSFSRLSLLRDDSGNIIYPNWDIDVSAQAGFMQNKSEVLTNIVQLASQRAFEATPGNLAYLKMLQKLGVPYIEVAIRDIEIEIKRQQDMQDEQMKMQKEAAKNKPPTPQGNAQPQGQMDMQQAQQLISQMPPEAQQKFRQLLEQNPQAAMQMLQDAMQGGGQSG